MEIKDSYFEAKEAKRGTLLELIDLMDGEKSTGSSVVTARLNILKSE